MKIFIPIMAGAILTTGANAVDMRQYVFLRASDVLSGTADISHVTHNARLKESFGIRVGGGVKLADFRTELELGAYSAAKTKNHDIANFDVRNTTIMANAYYDLITNSPFTPYIGIGAGYNRMHIDGDTDATLALRAGFGVTWSIRHEIDLDVAYNYTDFGNYDQNGIDASICGHEIIFGARYSF